MGTNLHKKARLSFEIVQSKFVVIWKYILKDNILHCNGLSFMVAYTYTVSEDEYDTLSK